MFGIDSVALDVLFKNQEEYKNKGRNIYLICRFVNSYGPFSWIARQHINALWMCLFEIAAYTFHFASSVERESVFSGFSNVFLTLYAHRNMFPSTEQT